MTQLWKPIDSAPKDGTEIIVFHPEAGVCAAFCPTDGFAWHCMDGTNTVVGSKSGKSIPAMTSFLKPPTHWMPMPAAPGTPPASAQDDAKDEKIIQAAVHATEPLRRLGEYLSRVLDEDQWAIAESMILGACNNAPTNERSMYEAWERTRAGYPFARQFANLMWEAWQARASVAAPAAGDARDAARYRWLRDPQSDVALVLDKRTGYVPEDERIPGVGGYHTYEYRAGEELDSAIDEAIAASQQQEG